MPAELQITLGNLQTELGRFQGYGRSVGYASMSANAQQDITAFVARGLRQFYYPPPLPGEGSSHQWSFMKKRGTFLFPAPLAPTPTCTVVNGVVTFLSSALTSGVANTVVTFASLDGYYEVDTYTSATVCTLKDLSVNIGTATTATFYYNRVAMPATGMDLNVFYPTATRRPPLKNVNSEYIFNVQQTNIASPIGFPEIFSIEAKNWPAGTEALVDQDFVMRVYPFCQEATTLTATYRIIPQTLQADTDIPLGGMAHYETIVTSCLAVAEEYGDTPSSKYRELFMQRLAASVMADRTGMYAGNLGYNGDNSDPLGRRQVRDFTVTYTPTP
jgi:hypothetical protein